MLIRRVALTTNEIRALPDNYAQSSAEEPFLRGFFQTNGEWLLVRDQNDTLTAPSHVSSFEGHSVFTVHVRVPGGRPATEQYLARLSAFALTNHLWAYQTNRFTWVSTNEPHDVLELNPAIHNSQPKRIGHWFAEWC